MKTAGEASDEILQSPFVDVNSSDEEPQVSIYFSLFVMLIWRLLSNGVRSCYVYIISYFKTILWKIFYLSSTILLFDSSCSGDKCTIGSLSMPQGEDEEFL